MLLLRYTRPRHMLIFRRNSFLGNEKVTRVMDFFFASGVAGAYRSIGAPEATRQRLRERERVRVCDRINKAISRTERATRRIESLETHAAVWTPFLFKSNPNPGKRALPICETKLGRKALSLFALSGRVNELRTPLLARYY